ncbi:NAD(P)H-binding protein [Thiomicrorhabdus aquaedulcis]|uniref:NAD(P)H-binding protein n=1 Tax=Thiomicrorhabdus aquaedulcis TaxID=2211106 RepID=UPI000FDBB9CA|nr:NAD(P)H-binding protein [Thiomicrorhabdus aquaedulcis]
MLGNNVTVFGGSGFVGREVVNALSKAGYVVTLVVRRPERFREFALFPNTKVVALSGYDKADELYATLQHADIMVNLTADRLTGTEKVEEADLVGVAQKLKAAAEHMGVKRVLSLSLIGASSTKGDNDWLRHLGEADGLMMGVVKADVTVLRAGLLIGPNDGVTSAFIKQLDRMALLMVANADTVVQPLWVKDFAQAFVQAIPQKALFNQKIEVAGEERLSVKELGELVAEIKQKTAIVFPMCRLNAKFMVFLGALAPFASVSAQQLLTLKEDSDTDQDFATRFGFMPSSLEWVIASYATVHHIRERYNFYRREAGRNSRELV